MSKKFVNRKFIGTYGRHRFSRHRPLPLFINADSKRRKMNCAQRKITLRLSMNAKKANDERYLVTTQVYQTPHVNTPQSNHDAFSPLLLRSFHPGIPLRLERKINKNSRMAVKKMHTPPTSYSPVNTARLPPPDRTVDTSAHRRRSRRWRANIPGRGSDCRTGG